MPGHLIPGQRHLDARILGLKILDEEAKHLLLVLLLGAMRPPVQLDWLCARRSRRSSGTSRRWSRGRGWLGCGATPRTGRGRRRIRGAASGDDDVGTGQAGRLAAALRSRRRVIDDGRGQSIVFLLRTFRHRTIQTRWPRCTRLAACCDLLMAHARTRPTGDSPRVSQWHGDRDALDNHSVEGPSLRPLPAFPGGNTERRRVVMETLVSSAAAAPLVRVLMGTLAHISTSIHTAPHDSFGT